MSGKLTIGLSLSLSGSYAAMGRQAAAASGAVAASSGPFGKATASEETRRTLLGTSSL